MISCICDFFVQNYCLKPNLIFADLSVAVNRKRFFYVGSETSIGLCLIGLGFASMYPCAVQDTPLHFGRTFSQIAIGYQMGTATIGYTVIPIKPRQKDPARFVLHRVFYNRRFLTLYCINSGFTALPVSCSVL